MKRRLFLTACAAACANAADTKFDVARFDRERVLRNARKYLADKPVSVTAAQSPRSAGGPHDFFSEGDYWWPDPKNPDGPYIQRDGMTNPDNFVEHRKFLMKLSVQAPALAATWKLTGDKRYSNHAAAHIRAWFVDEATCMNPNLQFAQTIHDRTTGRGTGVIDTIHLVEVARAIPLLAEAGSLSFADFGAAKKWFAEYTHWMNTCKNGMEEGDAKNNHGTCWVMQVAAFVPGQIEPDGSQPLEMRRTKPYGYCLFNLEALTTICQDRLRIRRQSLELRNARWLRHRQGNRVHVPVHQRQKSWKGPPDVMYFDKWRMRQEALLFGGLAYQRADYLDVWRKLPPDSDVDEVIRNFFIRQPVLWVN